MKTTILTNSINSLGLPLNSENSIKRSNAFSNITNTFEKCYRECYKCKKENKLDYLQKIQDLISTFKDEINIKLEQIAISSSKEAVEPNIAQLLIAFIQWKRDELKEKSDNTDDMDRYAKSHLRADLGEMLLKIRGNYNFSMIDNQQNNENCLTEAGIEFHRVEPPDLEHTVYPETPEGEDR